MALAISSALIVTRRSTAEAIEAVTDHHAGRGLFSGTPSTFPSVCKLALVTCLLLSFQEIEVLKLFRSAANDFLKYRLAFIMEAQTLAVRSYILS